MTTKTLVKLVLPPIVTNAIRSLRGSQRGLSIRYETISGWPRDSGQSSWVASPVVRRLLKGGETFDLDVVRQTPSRALESPIVRDNLAALRRIGLRRAVLLDLGCGNGLYRPILSHYPATREWQYVGVDISRELVEWCRTAHGNTRFEVVGEGRPLPLNNNECDIALVSGVLQCIEDYASTLAELWRVAKEYVVISRVPVWKYKRSRIVLQHVIHSEGVEQHPIHVFNRETLEREFQRTGFRVMWRDYGCESFDVPSISERAVHNVYLLGKA